MFVSVAALGTFAALFALVTLNIMLQQTGVERSALEQRVRAQRLELEQLELERARLESPVRIERRAAELGLVAPEEVVVLAPSSAAASSASASSRPSPSRGRE